MEVHERLHNRFDVSTVQTTKILRAAFPQAEKKRSGWEEHSYYMGITWKSSPVLSLHCTNRSPTESPTQPSMSLVPQSSLGTASLLARNQDFEPQIRLEEKIENQQAVISAYHLEQEVAFHVHSEGQTVHGPDTPEHFRSFSLEQVSTEVQSGAPRLQTLGDTRRNVEDDEGMTVEETKSANVLLHSTQCTLMNGKGALNVPGFHAGYLWYHQAGKNMYSLISVPWLHHFQYCILLHRPVGSKFEMVQLYYTTKHVHNVLGHTPPHP